LLFALAVGILVVGAIVFAGAVLCLRRSTTGSYYAIRKQNHAEGIRRLRRALVVLVFGVALAGVAAIVPADAMSISDAVDPAWRAFSANLRVSTPTPAPTALPTATAVPPSATPVPPTATAAPTLAPTATAQPPTRTPDPTLAALPTAPPASPTAAPTLTPAPTATIVPSGKPTAAPRAIALSTIASAYDAQEQPVGSATEFASGLKNIFVFFNFQNLATDTPIQHVWLRDSTQLSIERTIWKRAGSGLGFLTLSQPDGFKPGLYQVRVLLESEPAFVANFVVK
jgi:hypothetical protein